MMFHSAGGFHPAGGGGGGRDLFFRLRSRVPSACRVDNVFIGAMNDLAARQMNLVTSSPNPPISCLAVPTARARPPPPM